MYSKKSKKLNQRGGKAKRKTKRTNLWAQAFKQARKQLNIKGFHAIKKGTALYAKTKQIHLRLKDKQ